MNNIPVQKNKEYIVKIIDNGFEGEGIARIDNFTIFVPGAIKGEEVKILIVKVLSSHAFAKIVNIINESKHRQESDCGTYKRCGGCNMRHIKYEETLEIKKNAVQSLINKNLKNKIKINEIIGMEEPFHYRNKLQYPLGINKENKPVIGVYTQRSHEIIPTQKCIIQNQTSEEIAKFIFKFIEKNKIPIYDEKTGKGIFRHIMIRIGVKTNEVMCVFVINSKSFPKQNELVKELLNKYNNIKTIVININMKKTNVILGKENINLYGDGFITDILGKYKFKISPLSFYQVNPVQTEKLYNLAIKLANINKNDIAFDLYSGVGTISLFMANFAKKVYGVEIVKDAVDNAYENAKMNGIDNVEFIEGDAEIIFDDLINVKGIIPDVLMVDPPRKGLDSKSIDNILRIKPKRWVYISCNPATLVRDLAKVEDVYDVGEIVGVDMFPFTSHVETVALLCLKYTTNSLI